MNPSRRTFLVTGTLGVAALAVGGFVQMRSARPAPGRALGAAGERIVGAMLPAFLAGALPDAPDARAAAVRETLAAVDTAIAGLPPATQSELTQLFGLLSFAPARIAAGGPWSDWPDATTASVDATLRRWQSSRVSLLRSAYDGLHQIVLAAWYGSPRAWAAIGYPGPPALS